MHRGVIYDRLYCNTLGLNINFSRLGCNSNSGCPKLKGTKKQQISQKKTETISCYKQLFDHILFVLIGWFAIDPQVHLSLSVLQKYLNCPVKARIEFKILLITLSVYSKRRT